MTEIRVGAELSSYENELTQEEISAGCTGNPDDPYDSLGERMEGCFVGKIVSGILIKIGFNDPDGFCSTYREWHIFLRGFYSGFNTPLGAKFDPLPYYWKDEAQYYETAQELGYILKNGAVYIPSSSILTLIIANLTTIINTIKTTMSM